MSMDYKDFIAILAYLRRIVKSNNQRNSVFVYFTHFREPLGEEQASKKS